MRLDWIAAQPVSFSNPLIASLSNSCDEGRWMMKKCSKSNIFLKGRRLQTARDGQEIDPASASTLLQSMAVFKLTLFESESYNYETKETRLARR